LGAEDFWRVSRKQRKREQKERYQKPEGHARGGKGGKRTTKDIYEMKET